MESHNKDEFVASLAKLLNDKFEVYELYFDYKYKNFFELRVNVYQIVKCLMLEMYTAAFTLTNHVLERLLKIALINKAVGIRGIPTEQWEAVFSKPNADYGSITLAESIKLCSKENLIDNEEYKFLYDEVRNSFRNGYSHADIGKILKDVEPEMTLFEFKFSNPSEGKPVIVNRKMLPMIQGIDMQTFAQEHAEPYFVFVFNLIEKITVRLESFDKEKDGDR